MTRVDHMDAIQAARADVARAAKAFADATTARNEAKAAYDAALVVLLRTIDNPPGGAPLLALAEQPPDDVPPE